MSNAAWAVLIGAVLVGGAVAFWYVNRRSEDESEADEEETESAVGLLDASVLSLDELDAIIEEIAPVAHALNHGEPIEARGRRPRRGPSRERAQR